MIRTARTLTARGAAVVASLGLLVACSDGRSVEAFCDQVAVTLAVGPLFPDRTDGEPVADPDALDALVELADVAPDDIADDVDVLVAEARALVAEASARRQTTTTGAASTGESTTTTASPNRPERAEVDAAQAAVADYVDTECDLDVRS